MHLLGRSMSVTAMRQGGGMDTLVDEAFSFEGQASYETPLTLMPGDSIRTVCNYENTTSGPVGFGEGTGDEMCFAFVYAYPANTLASSGGFGGRNFCLGF